MRRVLLLVSGVVCCAGCVVQERGVPSPAASPSGGRPLRTEFACAQYQLVADRYLLLPVALERDPKEEFKSVFGLASYSWSGLSGGTLVNLEIVDLTDGAHHRVFDHPVALGEWGRSFRSGHPDSELCFAGLLVLQARAVDANGDREIDWRDPVWICTYDLGKAELRRVSPEARDVTSCRLYGDAIVMTVRRDYRDRNESVYVYRPGTGTGAFVVEDLVP
jgi:hypothetical protein